MNKDIHNIEKSYDSIVVYPNNVDIFDVEKFYFPEELKFLRIDVGLSDDSSQSVEWLLNTNDRAVIAIEPHPDNVQILLNGNNGKRFSISINNNFAKRNDTGDEVKINGRYVLIRCAIDNVNEKTIQKFYSVYPDLGNSGLIPFQNTKISGNEIKFHITIPTISLNALFEKIDWSRFHFIEVMKTDTELNDLNVLKSCEKYLKRIVYLRVEAFKGVYPNTATDENPSGWYDTATPITEYLEGIGFKLIDESPGDFKYKNLSLENLINTYNLST